MHCVVPSIFYLYLMPLILCCRPRSNTCKTCDRNKIQCEATTDEHALAKLKAELHRKAERTYQQLCEDTAQAQCSDDVDTIMFDLQQSLPTPTLTVNVVFYK